MPKRVFNLKTHTFVLLAFREMKNTMKGIYQIVELQLDKWMAFLPKEYRAIFEKFGAVGLDLVLDLEIAATEAFTPQYFLDELKGMAAGAGIE